MYLIDSHCHLNFEGLTERLPEVFAHMDQNNVRQALAISVNRSSFAAILRIAEDHPHVFATVGTHPNDTETNGFGLEELITHAQHPKVVGIGETGLDYYRSTGDLSWQHQRFEQHIQAAKTTSLPLVIHTRKSAQDTLHVLKSQNAPQAVMHCFVEDVPTAKAALDLGYYLSFSGIVTFKNATDVQATARYCPLDRLLVETDSPYLAPTPHRGKTNEPAFVHHTAEFLAQLRGEDLQTIAHASTTNFYRLFHKVTPLH